MANDTSSNITPEITLFGIPNCDTVKKSRAWLDATGKTYVFHDFKKQGVPEAALRSWVEQLGWEALLNKRGTTWRKLPAQAQLAVVDASSAVAMMLTHSSLIKRPVVHIGSRVSVGYQPEKWVD